MDGMDLINSFVFDEYAVIHQEIGPISAIKHNLFVADRNRIFSVDVQSTQDEFIFQAPRYTDSSNPGSSALMDCSGDINNMMRNRFSTHHAI